MSATQSAIEQAHELLNRLPAESDWDQIAYHMEVRASIDRGLADVEAGRTYTTEEVRKRFALDE
ncbi:MAG: hypothetical protein ACPG4N_11520 [Gammaproteobacteria bacterium]